MIKLEPASRLRFVFKEEYSHRALNNGDNLIKAEQEKINERIKDHGKQ